MIYDQFGTVESSADILVVDDTPENLRVVVALLKEAGHTARGIPNGELALQSVAKQPPDLILLDIRMPGMDGFKVCEALRDSPQSRDIPIIFLSALTDTADKQRAFEAGGVDYITKPFQATEILARVKTHLELARIRKELIHTWKMLEHLLQKQVQGVSKDIAPVSGRALAEGPADILVVDDETEVLRLINDLLRNGGYGARGMSSGEMALQAVDKQAPDLILLDILMPGMDGFQVCEALRGRATSRDIPIIFLTQLTDVADMEQAFKAGAVDYIVKPVKPEELLARVSTHLRLRRMQLGLEQMVADRAAELAASEARYRTSIQTALDGFWMADRQGRLIQVNDSYCQMIGYRADELLTMKIADLEAAETAVETAAHIKKIISQGGDRFETRHRKKDGSLLDLEVSVQYRPEAEGRIITFLRDITERKRAEEALRESEERYRLLVETANEAIIVAQDGMLKFANPRTSELSGYSNQELLSIP
ncbi:MAG: response regulator, partial [Chloroflexi bacterium]|nr:response regulator [Chloroflexota bacterium]